MITPIDDDLDYVPAAMTSDLDAMLVFNLLRTHGTLSPFIDAELRRQDLTSAQLNALLALRGAGDEGLFMREIGRKLVVTKSNVTALVDRLERQGLVARFEHTDRRATLVRLTRAGSALIDRITPRHTELLAGLTAGLTDADKKTLIRLLTKLRRGLREKGAQRT